MKSNTINLFNFVVDTQETSKLSTMTLPFWTFRLSFDVFLYNTNKPGHNRLTVLLLQDQSFIEMTFSLMSLLIKIYATFLVPTWCNTMRKCIVLIPFSLRNNISLSCHLRLPTSTKTITCAHLKIFLLILLLTFAISLAIHSTLIYLIETTKTSATSYIIFPFFFSSSSLVSSVSFWFLTLYYFDVYCVRHAKLTCCLKQGKKNMT